jgi:hypothetical protein
MTKPVCCLLLALGLAACAPKKAVEVPEAQAPTGTRSKPANRTSPGPVGPQEPQAPTLVNQQSGIRVPDLTQKLPDRKEMAPTAPVAPGGGGGAIATPPTADKRGE